MTSIMTNLQSLAIITFIDYGGNDIVPDLWLCVNFSPGNSRACNFWKVKESPINKWNTVCLVTWALDIDVETNLIYNNKTLGGENISLVM